MLTFIFKTNMESSISRVIPDSASYSVQLTKVRKLLELGENAINDSVVEELGNDVSAIYSVPTAIYCFLRAQQPIPNIEVNFLSFFFFIKSTW